MMSRILDGSSSPNFENTFFGLASHIFLMFSLQTAHLNWTEMCIVSARAVGFEVLTSVAMTTLICRCVGGSCFPPQSNITDTAGGTHSMLAILILETWVQSLCKETTLVAWV
jgi:hypothetical protein